MSILLIVTLIATLIVLLLLLLLWLLLLLLLLLLLPLLWLLLLLLLLWLVPFISLIHVAIGTLFVPVGLPETIPVAALAIMVSLHIVSNGHVHMTVCLLVNCDALFAEEALVEMYPVFDFLILFLPFHRIC